MKRSRFSEERLIAILKEQGQAWRRRTCADVTA